MTCPPDEWQCNSSQCIPSRWRCDGSFDCADRSDELGCPPHHIAPDDQCHFNGEFRCRSTGQCIHQSWVCDLTPDCEDESDEANCKFCFALYTFTSQAKPPPYTVSVIAVITIITSTHHTLSLSSLLSQSLPLPRRFLAMLV